MSLILKYDLGNPHRLPVGYTPLAYIESTGTLYIDTGWVPGVDSKIDTTIIPSDNSALSPANPITCIYTSDNKLIFEYFINKNEQTLYYSVNGTLGTSTNGNKSTSDGKFIGPLHCVYTTDKFICNGETLVSSSKPTIETSYNCYIFAYNNKGTIDSRHIACKLYSFKGFDNNTLVRDFIPTRRNSDGIIGLFDCVSQTFKTNAGTGAFIAGPEVVVLPHEYLLVEYLKGNGLEWIDTGVSCGTTDIVNTTWTLDSTEANGEWQGINGQMQLSIANNSVSDGANTISIFKLTNVEYNYNNGSSTLKVGSTSYTRSWGLRPALNIYLWKLSNYSGALNDCKISKFYANKAGAVVRNMVACYRRSDMKPGMYDLVNKVFYTNSGSGEFILGPVVEESSRQLEYNNSGSNYIGIPKNIHHSTSNPSSTLINLGSGNFNTNSWIKLPRLQNLVNGSISFWLKVNTLKNIVIVGNEDLLYYLGATRNGTGAWYHHNCGTITTYVDGVVKTTPTADTNWHHIVFTGVNLSAWTTAYLNKYISESSGWNVNGCYYDFRIYNNVLTADEVLQIYKGGL